MRDKPDGDKPRDDTYALMIKYFEENCRLEKDNLLLKLKNDSLRSSAIFACTMIVLLGALLIGWSVFSNNCECKSQMGENL